MVPYNPGGAADADNRLRAVYFEKYLGIPVIVQNIAGAAGLVGTNTAFASKSDGYTMVAGGLQDCIYGYKNFSPSPVPWELDQWKGTGIFNCLQAMGLACLNDSPWQDFADLIEDARSKPPKSITLASIGPGRFDDVWVIEIQKVFGVDFNWVFYEGTGAILTDLLTGDLDVGMVQVGRPDFINHPDFRTLVGFTTEYPDGCPYKGEHKTLVDFQERLGYKLTDIPALTTPAFSAFFVKADIPDEAYEVICDTIKKMAMDPEWQEENKAFNWPTYIPVEDQNEMFKQLNAVMESYVDLHKQLIPR